MSTVVLHGVVSLDGFVAGPDDDPGPIFDWYVNGDHRLDSQDMADPAPGGLRVSRASYDYVRPMWDAIGVMVIGRHLFDLTNGWEGRPPTGDHVVVVSHRPKPDGWHPEAAYHFVDDLTAAIATARGLAGDRVVALAAGDVGGQALALGLVDEVALDLAPVVLGEGKRFFGPNSTSVLLDDPHVVIQGDRVLHLRYRVRR
ncbi:dihydrofolate reductase family protein [Nocardioides KLBMP 9356]|uniref:Dihydrofolate reductase family protein n=1 Tax=Nocardioides potassii TaxID=2911371 RepID=A0ABS9HF07_9ACTN|nr:dihydrofolate reductase family protein [Nocardioides potassii]MCF6378916.1 dihydrofolate reductase family protein [Nocardioides potassii]